MSIPSAIRPILAAVALMSATTPVWAQVESREGIALQNQILEVQRQVQGLQAQAGRGSPTNLGGGYSTPAPSASSGDLMAQLLSRVSALEDQVRQLRGRVDELQNQADRQSAELSKKIDDMAFQSQNPGASARPAPPSTMSQQPGALSLPAPQPMQPQPPQPPQSPSAPVKRTPEMSMQEGNAALARRDYTSAEQAAREVLIGNRTSPRAYDAQFLLAQALMGQRQFSQAAIAYDDTYNRSRRGAHAEDALLGLANSLAAINEKKAACDTLGKLRAEFPTPRPDLREGIASAAQRSGCR